MSGRPWHELCELRDDVRSGKLTLDEFAADLNAVRTGEAPSIYKDPDLLFARTYPTYRMKVLARDVLTRLAGQGGKSVLRLQVAYGGGKTHTLITLLHLAEKGAAYAQNPTVAEFSTFAGLPKLPMARVAILPGDKHDFVNGIKVFGPDGKPKQVLTLWGALAYQLAGDVGYNYLKKHDEDFIVPAEPLLVDLLKVPPKENLGSLVLIDEAVWYYRQAVNANPRLLGSIKDFYQVLTQAVAKVEQASLTASIMASKVEANDQTGTQCLVALEEIFGRIAEPIEPVTRDDVAEVLRRRLFAKLPGEEARRPTVNAMMGALNRLPVSDQQRDETAQERYLNNYPFHPDLIEVLYQKWTQVDKFQRTRGALRLLATALRESADYDPAPFIGPSALLRYRDEPGKQELSPALSELVDILSENYKWLPALRGELEKVRPLQATLPSLAWRELEQAVVATFLHSQPIGKHATLNELLGLLAHPAIDVVALEEGLRKWREESWFLVENANVWQLGTTANLTHMHYQAKLAVTEPEITDELRRRIQASADLKAADSGVFPHVLPKSPRDVDDNLQLHYLVLEPECAVIPGKPIPQAAEAYFNEKAGPRVYRNNILALAPESASVAGLREQVRNWLGWNRLEKPENHRLLTDDQKKTLLKNKQETSSNLPDMIVSTYRILLAVNEDGGVQAYPLRSGSGGTPFERIKALLIEEERLVADTLDPDLLLPNSYFQLWAAGQTTQRVTALMAAFAQFPRLPRLLRPESLYETLKRGVREGVMVLRFLRPDGSAQTWWRIPPDDEILRRADIELQPASIATLHTLAPELVQPDKLEGLWSTSPKRLTLEELRAFFDGKQAPRLRDASVLEETIRQAVRRGLIVARINDSALFREDVPVASFTPALELYPPPPALSGGDLTAQALPEVWNEGKANLKAIANQLSTKLKLGYPIPWTLLDKAVSEALTIPLFEIASGSWPCSPAVANEVIFQTIKQLKLTPDMIVMALSYASSGAPTLQTIKETVEKQFLEGRSISLTDFSATARTVIQQGKLTPIEPWQEDNLSTRVRRPDTVLFGETQLNSLGLEKLGEKAQELYTIAEGMEVIFKVTVTLEGQVPDDQMIQQINALLAQIQAGWTVSR